MAPGGAVPEILDALPKLLLGALGLSLSLYGHGCVRCISKRGGIIEMGFLGDDRWW